MAAANEIAHSLQERVRTAVSARVPLVIRAGGTKDFYGNPLNGQHEVLDPRCYCGVIDYEPTELVVTACSGTPLADLEATLAQHNQMLGFEPPHFGSSATLGGAVASGLAGPRRATAGAVRDFVLGATLIDGRANVLSFGGRVMKNVAGYDISRALAGSLGTLGVILDISLKVIPRPPMEQTLQFEMSEPDAIVRTNEWAGQPLPVSATAWADGVLSVRLSGAVAGVRAARARLGGDALDPSTAFWTGLREHTHGFFDRVDGATLWRLAVPPTTAPLALGVTMIEWRGGQRWVWSSAPAATVREKIAAVGGHATAFRHGDGIDTFHPLSPGLTPIHQRLKDEFDPSHIFNPGRMIEEHADRTC